MKRKVAVLTTTLTILGSTLFPSTLSAFTPDVDGNFIPPSVIKSSIEALTPKASFDTSKVIEMSQKYIGVSYLVAGKSPKGFDCSGFVSFIFKKSVDIALPGSAEGIFTKGASIEMSKLQSGDLVFFKTSSKTISHIGIYIGDGKFIHSESSRGVVISSLYEKYYANRYQGAKRI